MKDWKARSFSIQIGESSKIIYERNTRIFTFERGKFSGKGTFEKRHCLINHLKNIRIFKDTSSLEIFINDGEEVFTSRVFDRSETETITFSTIEGSVTMDVMKWNLQKVFDY